MGRSPYQSEKRRKELARLKKQEEKRQRRFNKKHEGDATADQSGESPEGPTPETPAQGGGEQQDTPEAQQDASNPS